jgi:hypothetical protein
MDGYQLCDVTLAQVRPYGLEFRAIRQELTDFNGRIGCRAWPFSDQLAVLQPHDQFKIDCEDGLWTWLPATDDLVAAAQEMTRRLPTGVFLRSLDALHLTCARRHGHEHIYSNDRHLLLAAPHFGLQPGLLSR